MRPDTSGRRITLSFDCSEPTACKIFLHGRRLELESPRRRSAALAPPLVAPGAAGADFDGSNAAVALDAGDCVRSGRQPIHRKVGENTQTVTKATIATTSLDFSSCRKRLRVAQLGDSTLTPAIAADYVDEQMQTPIHPAICQVRRLVRCRRCPSGPCTQRHSISCLRRHVEQTLPQIDVL